jgi:hypothetical protein
MVRKAFGATLSLLLSGLIPEGTAMAQNDAASPEAQPACALPAVAVSAELNQIPNSTLVTVPVEINGKPKQFLLAVSANASEVSQATVKELSLLEGSKRSENFQSGPSHDSPIDSARNFLAGSTLQATFVDVKGANAAEEDRPHVVIPTFTVGTATGRNLVMAIAADNNLLKSVPHDGLMTGSFFKQYDVELDFTAMKINYLTANTCADPHQVVFWPHKEVAVIPMDMASGKIEVQVDIAGHQVNAVIDTASPRTIMRRDIAENTLGLKANSPQMPPAGDMRDGDDMQVYTATFPQITFAGGVTAFNVPALIQINGMTHNLHREATLGSRAQFKADPRIPALTLGMDVLRQLHLYIVYGQKSIYMTAAE